MDRVTWIQHKGKKILYVDYSGLRAKIPEEKKIALEAMEEVKRITRESDGEMRYLTNVTDSLTDTDLVDALKEVAAVTGSSKNYVKDCVVGVTSLQKMLVTMLNLMSKTKVTMKNTIEEAKDWLVE